jgi:hypothetical protein
MLTTMMARSMGDKFLKQEQVVLVSQGNHLIHSFNNETDAKKWLDARSKRPGVHPTVRMLKRTVTFEELGNA